MRPAEYGKFYLLITWDPQGERRPSRQAGSGSIVLAGLGPAVAGMAGARQFVWREHTRGEACVALLLEAE